MLPVSQYSLLPGEWNLTSELVDVVLAAEVSEELWAASTTLELVVVGVVVSWDTEFVEASVVVGVSEVDVASVVVAAAVDVASTLAQDELA